MGISTVAMATVVVVVSHELICTARSCKQYVDGTINSTAPTREGAVPACLWTARFQIYGYILQNFGSNSKYLPYRRHGDGGRWSHMNWSLHCPCIISRDRVVLDQLHCPRPPTREATSASFCQCCVISSFLLLGLGCFAAAATTLGPDTCLWVCV